MLPLKYSMNKNKVIHYLFLEYFLYGTKNKFNKEIKMLASDKIPKASINRINIFVFITVYLTYISSKPPKSFIVFCFKSWLIIRISFF